jgi:hypothetical protein
MSFCTTSRQSRIDYICHFHSLISAAVWKKSIDRKPLVDQSDAALRISARCSLLDDFVRPNKLIRALIDRANKSSTHRDRRGRSGPAAILMFAKRRAG